MSKFSRLRTAAVASAVALALTTAACLKQEAKTVVTKDGSGTFSQSMTIDLSKIAQLQELAKGFGGGEPGGAPGMDAPPAGEPESPFGLDEMKEAAKIDGIKITKAEQEKKDGKQTIRIEGTFTELGILGKANLLPGAAELVKNDDGSYTLTFTLGMGPGAMGGGEAGMDGGMAGGMGPEGMPEGMDPSMIAGMLEPFMGEMSIAETLVLPGSITDTNGTKGEDGSTVSWKLGFKELSSGKAKMTVTFKGEGLELKPFKSAPDTAKLMEGMTKPRHGAKPGGALPPAPPPTTPSDPPKPGGEEPAKPEK